jgi:hypothetical protein
MSDQINTATNQPDLTGSMGFDDDANDLDAGTRGEFLYDGRPMTAEQFTAHVQAFDFGAQGLAAPDFVVLHHSASPCTTLTEADARHGPEDWIRKAWVWDPHEDGQSEATIRAQRQQGLENLRKFYEKDKGWDRGPHLFIDNRYIWLFTPMSFIGVHALGGNSFRLSGTPHRSIGIEVIGYYEKQPWPPDVARLVAHAVNTLRDRLGTFELVYLYPNGSPISFEDEQKNVHYVHPERLAVGGICAHRDFNKPMCPGAAITADHYIAVLQRGAIPLQPLTLNSLALDSPIVGPPSGTPQDVIAFVQAQLPAGSEYSPTDVATIVGFYWSFAPGVGLDPFLAAVQWALETHSLTGAWAARKQGRLLRQSDQPTGLQFASWELSVQAHLGLLLAYALTDAELSAARLALIRHPPRYPQLPANQRGTVRTVQDLAGHWSADPDYAQKLIALAQQIRSG